jgi:hypothetical protein
VTLERRSTTWLKVDAGVVDNSVHPSDLVDLVGNCSRLNSTAEITDDDPSRSRSQIREHGGAFRGTCVQNNFVAFGNEGARCCSAESIGGTSDEDATHVTLLW